MAPGALEAETRIIARDSLHDDQRLLTSVCYAQPGPNQGRTYSPALMVRPDPQRRQKENRHLFLPLERRVAHDDMPHDVPFLLRDESQIGDVLFRPPDVVYELGHV